MVSSISLEASSLTLRCTTPIDYQEPLPITRQYILFVVHPWRIEQYNDISLHILRQLFLLSCKKCNNSLSWFFCKKKLVTNGSYEQSTLRKLIQTNIRKLGGRQKTKLF